MCVDPWCLDPLLDPGFSVALGLATLVTLILLLYALVRLERTHIASLFTVTLFGSIAFELSILLPGMATSDESALFWRRAFCWGPAVTAATGAHFGVALNELRIARDSRVWIPFYLGALAVVMGHLTQAIDLDIVLQASGRREVVSGGPFDPIQRAYGAICILTLLSMMAAYTWRWRRHPVRSVAAKMMLAALIAPMGLALLVVLRPPFMPELPLYHLATPLFQITALYATARHGVFQITDTANARAAIEAMNEALVVVDADARVLFANPSASNTYGIEEQSDGTPLTAARPLIEAVLAEADGVVVRREAEVRGIPSRVGAARIHRRNRNDVVLVLTDVREEQEHRAALREAKEEAVAAEERAVAASRAKSAFLANMSHELRTPLNAIIGYSELLAEEETTPERREDLGRIMQSGRYLHALLGDILDLSKIDAGRLEVNNQEVRLAALIAEIEAPASLLCERNGNRLQIDTTPAVVHADPVRVRQILLNLVSNAAKFTEQGEVRIGLEVEGTTASLSVTDTGIGMDADQLTELFQRFRQVHRTDHAVYGGSGLGLSLSRELAGLMDGDLVATSTPGQGSCFTLTLPLATPVASEHAEGVEG